MAIKLNEGAYQHAEKLIEDGKYRINSIWRDAQPSENGQAKYLEAQGWGAYSKWYLGIDTDSEAGTPQSLRFPIGDFKSVHRTALLIAKTQAEKQNAADVVKAIDDLIFLFDRISAC
jgi:hypothetical protein